MLLPPQLNPNVAKYFEDMKKPIDGGSWLRSPEFPGSDEILDTTSNGSPNSNNVAIATNRVKGAWESRGK